LWRLLKVAFASLALVVFVSVLLLLFKQWRRIRVFITFQHDQEIKVRIMQDKLRAQKVNCEFIPFNPEAQHDIVLRQVTSRIQWADLVITVPGTEGSFVDSEILSAATLRKPLLILSGTHINRTINTAYEGYPRFSFECLEEYGYRPLADCIKHVCNQWSSVWSEIGSALGGFIGIWSASGGLIVVAHYLLGFVSQLVMIVSVKIAFQIKRIELYLIIALVVIATLTALVTFGMVVAGRIRARKISRQTTLTGKSTYAMLKDAIDNSMFDAELAKCLLKPEGAPFTRD